MLAKVVWLQCALFILVSAESAESDDDALTGPAVGFWVDRSFVRCSVSFEEFYDCCRKSKCAKKPRRILECCAAEKRRSSVRREDDLAKCVSGVEDFLKGECEKTGRSYCPYDGGASVCCTRPPCNVRTLKEKFCCD